MAQQRRGLADAEESLVAGVGVMATAIVAGGFDHMGEDDGNDDGGEDEGVCAAGQEVTGRWTRKEHELFLEALKRYGKVITLLKLPLSKRMHITHQYHFSLSLSLSLSLT